MKIMGVDISSRSSGWSIIENDKLLEYGLIVPQSKSMTNAQKMYLFQVELRKIIDAKQPDEIAIEDVIQVRSISVLKLLARFNGIAIIESYRYTQKEPDLYEPSKWKSIMGCGGGAKKCEVQLFICQKYNLLLLEKIATYQKRIDEAKECFGGCCDDVRKQVKLVKKELKKCKDENRKLQIVQEIKSLQEKFVSVKKSSKKNTSEVFDKISMDIYTATGINEDIADSLGVAICHQKLKERNK
jgi:Holliday junction resolvasome RuvABC endonuclease subunit